MVYRRSQGTGRGDSMKAAHKNDCSGGARQVAKSINFYATRFVAICAQYVGPSNGLGSLGLVLLVQAIVKFGGVL